MNLSTHKGSCIYIERGLMIPHPKVRCVVRTLKQHTHGAMTTSHTQPVTSFNIMSVFTSQTCIFLYPPYKTAGNLYLPALGTLIMICTDTRAISEPLHLNIFTANHCGGNLTSICPVNDIIKLVAASCILRP
jgi:hypothetical protein